MLSNGADQRAAATGGAAEVRSLAEALRLAMIHLGRQVRRHDPAELSIAQVSGLASVVHHGPLGVGRLAELESLPSSAATRLTDKLEAAGLVVRRATPGDRRGVRLGPPRRASRCSPATLRPATPGWPAASCCSATPTARCSSAPWSCCAPSHPITPAQLPSREGDRAPRRN